MRGSIERIVIVGAGNLATNLGEALKRSGKRVEQVFSRTEESASALAARLGCDHITSLAQIIPDADLYIVSVKDDVLGNVLGEVVTKVHSGIVVHTAGSIPMDIFGETEVRHGVFYPMQTFSKQKIVDFSKLPIFVEASDEGTCQALEDFARELSESVYRLDSDHRRYLHLAAVFACNFVNHCFTLADDVLREQGLPFSVMMPLIRETVSKVETISPRNAQTGPAVRGDKNVMDAQKGLIGDEMARKVYETMSESIISDKERTKSK